MYTPKVLKIYLMRLVSSDYKTLFRLFIHIEIIQSSLVWKKIGIEFRNYL